MIGASQLNGVLVGRIDSGRLLVGAVLVAVLGGRWSWLSAYGGLGMQVLHGATSMKCGSLLPQWCSPLRQRALSSLMA